THDQSEAMTMSDRVAVMMDGELLQIGPPEELYRNPQDLRVGEMIGTPKINVLPASYWPALASEQTTHVAFRPEGADVVLPGRGTFDGSIVNIEHLGSDIFLHLTLSGSADTIVVRTHPDAQRPEVGRTIGIRVDPSRL